jgi:bacillolysin
MNGVHKFFNDNKIKFDVEDANNEFVKLSEKDDKLGFKHIKTQQVAYGIPVFGNEYIVHFNNEGEVYAVNGTFDSKARDKKFDKTKFINGSKAINIAKSQVVFDELQMEPTAKLYLYQIKDDYIPVYEVRLNFISPEPADFHIFVDAVTGKVVDSFNRLANVAATGTGVGVLGDTKTLNLDKVTTTTKVRGKPVTSTEYQMKDITKTAIITTYSANYGTKIPGLVVASTSNVINDRAAVDAHFYAGIVYDYYKTKFNRNSIDGLNMAIKSTVHYKTNYNNAGWTGTQMIYGDGDGVQFAPLSGALDVIGHEITHGVDEHEANLVYKDQPGALNESLSDTFGAFIEFYSEGSNGDWLLGEDVTTPNIAGDALRSISDPTLYGDPAHMNDYLYTTADYGGVHTNSGIPNKASYLITTNPSIGLEKAEKIYYRALTAYLTSTSNFHDARMALSQSAQDLYGISGAEYNAVISAWNSVGVN